MRGVVLIALGHPLYTHMAYNLALSLRFHSDIPIVLFTQGGGINYLFADQKEIFSEIRELPQEFYIVDGKEHFIKSKLHLYDLTTFDETIFIDSDTIFSPYKKIENLFDDNKDCEIQFACRGDKQMEEGIKSEWVNLSEVKEIHGFNHWYELSSEFIYWKQGEVAQKVFDTAIDYYSNHGMGIKKWVAVNGKLQIENKPNCIMEFAGGIPDEVPFSMSLESTQTKIKSPYVPSYWQPAYFTKVIPDEKIKQDFYIISAGGATKQPNIERIYNNLAKFYCSKTERKRVHYMLPEKRRELTERKSI